MTALTKCTLAPLRVLPAASTASCTRSPYKPSPQNSGSSEGCTLMMRFSYSAQNSAESMRRKPASTTSPQSWRRTSALSSRLYSSSLCPRRFASTSVGIPAEAARSSA